MEQHFTLIHFPAPPLCLWRPLEADMSAPWGSAAPHVSVYVPHWPFSLLKTTSTQCFTEIVLHRVSQRCCAFTYACFFVCLAGWHKNYRTDSPGVREGRDKGQENSHPLISFEDPEIRPQFLRKQSGMSTMRCSFWCDIWCRSPTKIQTLWIWRFRVRLCLYSVRAVG